jgi:hypothetical protein
MISSHIMLSWSLEKGCFQWQIQKIPYRTKPQLFLLPEHASVYWIIEDQRMKFLPMHQNLDPLFTFQLYQLMCWPIDRAKHKCNQERIRNPRPFLIRELVDVWTQDCGTGCKNITAGKPNSYVAKFHYQVNNFYDI